MGSSGFIGADISQKWVDIARSDQRKVLRIDYTAAAVRRWLASLPPGCHIGVESTGDLHRLLVRCAMAAGHAVYVLNARDLSHYARALGRRAKTDRLDAQLIARYLANEHEHLHPYVEPTAQQAQLDELFSRRHTVVVTQQSLRQSFSGMSAKPRTIKRVLRALDELVKEIDMRVAELIAADPQHKATAQRLRTVVGFGPLLSATLTHALTRRAYRSADAFVAHTGYDPRPRDSGQKCGQRYLSKRGPAQLRRVLYTAAMSASKTKLWRPFYQRYLDRGLSTTQALVILARKLARIAYSMVKHGTEFNPELIKRACAQP